MTVVCINKMVQKFLTIFLIVTSTTCLGQSYEDFKKDFQKSLNKKFSKNEWAKMYTAHSSLLTPHSAVTQFSANINGEPIMLYPLSDFKLDKLYINNIDKLINSKNPNQRLLSYLVIASTGDTTFENALLEKIKEEKDKGCLIWAGMALLYLNTSHTTPLFDFLVEYEDFGDTHLLPLYIKLNKDSLQQTAYLRINSDKLKAKILAAQILAYTPLNTKTEDLLKNAVKDWDINIKGYAIFSIKEQQIGNLLETFKPLLDSSQTRSIALEALANSPTETDRQYLFDLTDKQDTISEDLLNCLYNSKNLDSSIHWLRLLHSRPIPKDYIFFISDSPLIRTDALLHELHITMGKIKDAKILGELALALQGRTDDKSTAILLALLTHNNSTVRYWAARSLEGNHSQELIAKLPELISDSSIRVTTLTNLAIENKLSNLQSIYEKIYITDQNQEWHKNSIEYLSAFPKDQHKEIFKKILQNKAEDVFIKRNAALGLGMLKDESSVDLIISASKEEDHSSDYNVQAYLIALGMIKGDKAKAEIEKYKHSKDQGVRKLVADILRDI